MGTDAVAMQPKADLGEKVHTLLSANNSPTTLPGIEAAAKGLNEDERLCFIAISLELTGQTEARIKCLKARIDGHSEYAALHPFMAYSLAEALASKGDVAGTEAILSQMSSTQPIDQADAGSVRTRMDLQLKKVEAAKRSLDTARKALSQAVPEASYRTWRSEVIEQRLTKMAGLIEAALPVDKDAYSAWLKADRARDLTAYQAVAMSYPKTIFADASILESARLQFDQGLTEPCLKLLDSSRLRIGPLAAPAEMLRGDALLLQGKAPLKDIRTAYEKALSLLRDARAPEDVTPEQKKAAFSLTSPCIASRRITQRGLSARQVAFSSRACLHRPPPTTGTN